MDYKFSFLVVGSALVIIPGADKSVVGTDMLNSVLLAQLVANKEVEKHPQRNWYDAYLQVLDDFWLRYAKAQQKWRITGDSAESAVDWIVGAMGKGEMSAGQLIAAALKQVAGLPGTEPAIGLLRKHLQNAIDGQREDTEAPSKNARLLVLLAQSATSLTSVYFEFQSHQAVGPNPFAQLHTALDVPGSVSMRYDQAKLAETRYSPVRDLIAQKVRDRLKDNVAVMTLSEKSQP
ncbi:hypothetical protein FQ192_23345 [Pseudomonas sp. ANT_J12]|jgi:hypothetical protein|uniref:hypothetical protein n=1 Tax=Pseudomonas sp. ANT_J12 TaxID=2597351 RepID=UPI0011F260B5|nr:hypothetical protein [Pseudomonas sp. ANT_J12]KAA0986573.1 hypothetical protein FQ192_23345 [Pseudomonas sp. ANT_J12]